MKCDQVRENLSLISRIRTSYPGVICGHPWRRFFLLPHIFRTTLVWWPLQGRVLSATHAGPLGAVAPLGLKPQPSPPGRGAQTDSPGSRALKRLMTPRELPTTPGVRSPGSDA